MFESLFRRKISYRCSFCGKSSVAVNYLIAGPEVYICCECVDVCSSILDKHIPDRDTRASKRLGALHFDYLQLKTGRDAGEHEQEAFLQRLAAIVSRHFDEPGDGSPATVVKLPR